MIRTSFGFLLAMAALGGCGPRTSSPTVAPAAVMAAACASDADCKASQVCRESVCVPYEGGTGEPCYDDLDCALDSRCASGSCSADP